MSSIVQYYVFSMLCLGHIVISDLLIADLFTDSLPGMIILYLVVFLQQVFLDEII